MSRSGSMSTSLRLDNDLLARVDASARAHGMTRSAWLRKLIVDGQAEKNGIVGYDLPAREDSPLVSDQPVRPSPPIGETQTVRGSRAGCGHRRWWRVKGVCVRCWETC